MCQKNHHYRWTSDPAQADIDACAATGMNDFVTKPIDRRALNEAIRRHIQNLTT